MKMIIHIKNLKIFAEKYTSSLDIFEFLFPLPREIVCSAFVRRFSGGQIFLPVAKFLS
jgi:hypothetical protein